MTRCPVCNSLSTIPIVYGKPSHELERAASRGLVELAGCITGSTDPSIRCLDCSHSWASEQTEVSSTLSAEEILSEVKTIVRTNLFSIFTGMAASELFSENGGSEKNGISSYLQLKEILGINIGFHSDHLDSVLAFKHHYPRRFTRIIDELEYQVCTLTLNGTGHGRIYGNLFSASLLLYAASPLCRSHSSLAEIAEFELQIRNGQIGVE